MSDYIDIIVFVGAIMEQLFIAFNSVFVLDTGLSILDIWIIMMLLGMVMDFISRFIEGYNT